MTLALDWDAYKRLCDTPDVISRWMLEQTAELLNGALRVELENALKLSPLLKPCDHKGGAATDMFQLSLTTEQVQAVHERIVSAVAGGATTSGTRARGLGGFEEAWREYVDHLNAASVR
jgi:hypothetical protein